MRKARGPDQYYILLKEIGMSVWEGAHVGVVGPLSLEGIMGRLVKVKREHSGLPDPPVYVVSEGGKYKLRTLGSSATAMDWGTTDFQEKQAVVMACLSDGSMIPIDEAAFTIKES